MVPKNSKGPFGGKAIVSLETVNAKSKIKVEWVDGKPEFIIDIRQTGSVAEINAPISLMQKGKTEDLEKNFQRLLKRVLLK